MDADIALKLTTSFSNERLDAYRSRIGDNNSNLVVFCHYAWNMALSESLYPSLQILEVSLRNSIYNAASIKFQRNDWYEDQTIISAQNDIMALNKAKNNLLSQRKKLEPSRIIAELNFGFWTSMLNRRYEQILWPALLKPCFPAMPRKIRTTANVLKRIQIIRRLRNRVFHHEPIWHWKDLVQQHADILDAIGWIEPAAQDLTSAVDSFDDVYTNGLEKIGQKFQKFCS